jgi:hypothetical protein
MNTFSHSLKPINGRLVLHNAALRTQTFPMGITLTEAACVAGVA